MKKILVILGVISLSACHTVYKDRLVEIPVPVYTDPPAPAKVEVPHLPILDLTPESSRKETAKAVWATIEVLEDYAESLKESIKPFEKEEK